MRSTGARVERKRSNRLAIGLALGLAMGSAMAHAARYESLQVPSADTLKADVDKTVTLTARLMAQTTQPCPDFPALLGYSCVLDSGTWYVTGILRPWILGRAIAT